MHIVIKTTGIEWLESEFFGMGWGLMVVLNIVLCCSTFLFCVYSVTLISKASTECPKKLKLQIVQLLHMMFCLFQTLKIEISSKVSTLLSTLLLVYWKNRQSKCFTNKSYSSVCEINLVTSTVFLLLQSRFRISYSIAVLNLKCI